MHAMRTVGINLTPRHEGRKVRAWDIQDCVAYTGTLVLDFRLRGRCFYNIVDAQGDYITCAARDDVIEFIK